MLSTALVQEGKDEVGGRRYKKKKGTKANQSLRASNFQLRDENPEIF
jgi:hypothetical protein